MHNFTKNTLLFALFGTVGFACAKSSLSPSYQDSSSSKDMQQETVSTEDLGQPAMESVEVKKAPRRGKNKKVREKQSLAKTAKTPPAKSIKEEFYATDSNTATIAVAPKIETNNTEQYTHYRPNPWVETAKDKFSTFSIDVDTASYTISRRKLTEGVLPPKNAVRVEEFLNYFRYDYAPPQQGAFAVHLEVAPSPFDASRYLLRVGMKGKEVSREERKPTHLTFLVDTSGSMKSQDKLGLVKKGLALLVDNLREDDTVAITTYAGSTKVVLAPTGVRKKKQILKAIANLESSGGTAMASGMSLAYEQALASYQAGSINRVIVFSDGDANIGPSSHQEILAAIKGYVKQGITMTTVGVGNGNYQDEMMEQLANQGNGNYVYLDSLKAAKRFFSEQINGTLEVIAKDVKLQIEFSDDVVAEYRLVGYENRNIADKDFRNDLVDAGEIGAGHSVTAFYEIKLVKNPTGKLASVYIRAKKPEGTQAKESVFSLDTDQIHSAFENASSDFQFASAVIAFAEKLRQNPDANEWSFDRIKEITKPNQNRLAERREFLSLVKQAISLGAR